MSHFSVYVAVASDKISSCGNLKDQIETCVDEALTTYDENATKSEFLEFEDKMDEMLKDYETDTMKVVRYPDGHLVGAYESEFTAKFTVKDNKILACKPGTFKEYEETEESRTLQLIPDYPAKDYYTFEEFCEQYHGYEKNGNDRWGYYHNPNGNWDWYQIGGRMSGSLLALVAARPNVLRSGEDSHVPGYIPVNAARKRDIAWAKMKALRYEQERQYFSLLEKAFRNGDVSDVGILTRITEEGIMRWNEVLAYKAGESFEEYLDRTGCSDANEYATSCYAFVTKDGVWHAQGEMGWFGLSSGDKPEHDWNEEIQKFFADLNDDDYIVMVDCHI